MMTEKSKTRIASGIAAVSLGWAVSASSGAAPEDQSALLKRYKEAYIECVTEYGAGPIAAKKIEENG